MRLVDSDVSYWRLRWYRGDGSDPEDFLFATKDDLEKFLRYVLRRRVEDTMNTSEGVLELLEKDFLQQVASKLRYYVGETFEWNEGHLQAVAPDAITAMKEAVDDG